MKANIIRIGNSQGIRIPKPVLEQCGLKGRVEIKVKGGKVIIEPAAIVRDGWDEAFQEMAGSGDDKPLLNEEDVSGWDRKNWTW